MLSLVNVLAHKEKFNLLFPGTSAPIRERLWCSNTILNLLLIFEIIKQKCAPRFGLAGKLDLLIEKCWLKCSIGLDLELGLDWKMFTLHKKGMFLPDLDLQNVRYGWTVLDIRLMVQNFALEGFECLGMDLTVFNFTNLDMHRQMSTSASHS